MTIGLKSDKTAITGIRNGIQRDPGALRDIIQNPAFRNMFGSKLFEGDHLKTAPKGFDKTDPAIDLLRLKS